MKLSDYLVKYLEIITDSVFLLSGGGIMHLVDSLRKTKELGVYCCHHEQACAIAAEGYSRISYPGRLGVALVTTGPGGTNAITGVAGAWLDSIPMLVVSGQVKADNITPRKLGQPVVRAIGFQELNVIDLIRPITKYAVMVEDPNQIKYHLEKAIYLATSGRPGPVWVEVPLDIQAAEIAPKRLTRFEPLPLSNFGRPKIPMEIVIEQLERAKRPLMLVGNGIRLAGGVDVLWQVLNKLRINVISTMFTADDLVTDDYPFYLGCQGIPGRKAANWAIDNCDCLLVVGDRLQLTQTSYEYEKFATQVFKIMVDIDEAELHKKTIQIDLPICCDAKYFLEELCQQNVKIKRWDVKVESINPDDYQGKCQYLNVYRFLEELARNNKGYHLATTNGMASLTPHQALKLKKGQRLITNAGLGHMGSGLPMAVGACIADRKRPVICTEGDGSLMLNIQELQTVVHHQLPLKIFIFNNNGYYSIRSTHKRFFGKVFAADPDTGVSLPNFEKLIKAWGIEYEKIANDNELHKVKRVIDYNRGPIVCELMLDPDQPMPEKWTAGQYR